MRINFLFFVILFQYSAFSYSQIDTISLENIIIKYDSLDNNYKYFKSIGDPLLDISNDENLILIYNSVLKFKNGFKTIKEGTLYKSESFYEGNSKKKIIISYPNIKLDSIIYCENHKLIKVEIFKNNKAKTIFNFGLDTYIDLYDYQNNPNLMIRRHYNRIEKYVIEKDENNDSILKREKINDYYLVDLDTIENDFIYRNNNNIFSEVFSKYSCYCN